MRQQVNLLAPMYRKQQALFSARVSIGICLLVSVALTLIYFATVWRGAIVASQETQLQAQRDTANRRLNELAAQLSGRQSSSTLQAEVTTLTQERDRKVEALAALSQRQVGSTEGFSPEFIGLARQRLNGLWLTRIELTGEQITLQGITLSEDLVPRYLRKLGEEEVFAGRAFQQARLERVDEGGNQMRFELRTQASAGPAP